MCTKLKREPYPETIQEQQHLFEFAYAVVTEPQMAQNSVQSVHR